MAQITTRRQYAANEPLLASDLEAFIDDIEVFVNVINLNSDNIQDDGITASTKIIDGSLTGETLNNLAITTAKIADSNITTAKLADGAVTTAKILDDNVITSTLADATVSTANIADLAVTGAKLESALKTTTNLDISSSSTASNTSSYAVIGSVATITTQGGPVLMQGITGYFDIAIGTLIISNILVSLYIERAPSGGSYSPVFQTVYNQNINALASASSASIKIPVNILRHIDTPAAGTWQYRAAVKFYLEGTLSGGSVSAHTNPITTTASTIIVLKELI